MSLGITVRVTAATLAPPLGNSAAHFFFPKVKPVSCESQIVAADVAPLFRRQKNWRERRAGQFIASRNLPASLDVGWLAPKNWWENRNEPEQVSDGLKDSPGRKQAETALRESEAR
jgi:hypothetical protein